MFRNCIRYCWELYIILLQAISYFVSIIELFFRHEKLLIIEPCNSASNIAYYYMATGVCEYRYWSLPATTVTALVEVSANLATGKQHTKDNIIIHILVYMLFFM